jgi:hypothetical protein
VPCLLRVQVDDTYLKERRRTSFVVVWIGCRLLIPVFVVCDLALLQNVLAVVVAGTVMSVCLDAEADGSLAGVDDEAWFRPADVARNPRLVATWSRLRVVVVAAGSGR